MSYHLSNHIYVAQFRDELILLDAKKDKYTICFKNFSDALLGILGNRDLPSQTTTAPSLPKDSHSLSTSQIESPLQTKAPQNLSQIPSFVQKLLDDGILEPKETPYPFYIDQKPHSDGVSNVDWRLPLENKKIRVNLSVLKALITLIKVNG